MKIKDKLLLTAGISALLVIALGISLFLYRRSFDNALVRGNIAHAISQGVFEKRFFFDEYLLSHLDRSKDQWLVLHGRLNDYINGESAKFKSIEEKSLISEMMKDFERHKGIFLELIALHNAAGADVSETIRREKETRLANQFLVLSQDAMLQGNKLTAISRQDMISIQKAMTLIFIAFLTVLTAIIGFVLFSLWKSIVGPIGRLHTGARLIGKGQLDYKVGTSGRDEIGELSRAFDDMVFNLKDRDLKIASSNQQLKASNQQLRASNQQLDASMQQLRSANEQLIATEQGLKEKLKELEIFNKATVGREIKMAELKKENEDLREKLHHHE